MTHTLTIDSILDAYRDAVARRTYWEDNGTRKDGRLELAAEWETNCRNAVKRWIKQYG